MRCLDRTLASSFVIALALAGCSDDGLTPEADTDTSGTGTGTTSNTATNTETTLGQTTTPPGDSTTDGCGTADCFPSSSTGCDESGGCDSTTTDEPPPPPSMTCENPMQCVLVDDCCECAAYHIDDTVPECPMDCEQPMCSALGIPDIGVVCEAGMCELEKRDCSGLVVCDSLPPDCVDGTLPEVGNGGGGGCWTGACIPLEACDPVPGCEYCVATEACVATETMQATTVSCLPLPEDCMGLATCECMPPDTCAMPFDTCADADGQITCS